MTHPNATLAALVIFNGLKLSPVLASPDPRLQHIGSMVHPRFEQCANYLTRFFGPESTALDFAPYERIGNAVAVAPWLRGAVGMLQFSLHHTDGLDVPDCDNVEPEDWFTDLHEMVITYRLADQTFGVTAAAKVQETWEEPDYIPHHADSHPYMVARLYGEVRGAMFLNELLTDPVTIHRAKKKVEKSS